MKYLIFLNLTIILLSSILIIKVLIHKKQSSRHVHRQSDMHNMLKKFFTFNINNEKKSSQFNKRKEKDITKVVMLNDKAYWVIDNIFYSSDLIDGKVIPENGSPVDTSIMSTKEINMLLFILDKIKDGSYNDSGGSRN